jgi:hypothetical protein
MYSGNSIMYSCVVDAKPAIYHQVMVWTWTAIALAKIDPWQIVVHVIDGCDDRLKAELEQLDIEWVPVRRFPYGTPMCNKLVQLESEALLGRNRIVLSDCDLAWLAPIEAHLFTHQPRAKVVDFANPPIELLEPLVREAGFPNAAKGAVSIGGATTYHNNCNGGLMLVSGAWMRRVHEPWLRWLRWVEDRADQLGLYAVHMFQISLLLAAEEIGESFGHLPLEYNFPTHTDQTASCPENGSIRALHFHRMFDASGLLLSTGVARADAAIADVNEVIRERIAGAWWLRE